MTNNLLRLCTVATLALMSGCSSSSNSDEQTPNYQEKPTSSTKSVQLSSNSRVVKHLVDANNYALYTFDKDSLNQSNCPNVEGCVATWPAFSTAIAREDFGVAGEYTTYLQHPLYYFINDITPGDMKGDGIKGVWHLVYPAKDFVADDNAMLSLSTNKQRYLADSKGRALYLFDNDEEGKSNCYDMCAKVWPILTSSVDTTKLPAGTTAADFSTTTRKDGTIQATFKGKPLYYFVNDTNDNDTNGDWVKGVWHLVELDATIDNEIKPQPLASSATRDVAFLVDGNQKSLYTFDKDDLNMSNCPNVTGCEATWPAFTTLISRDDFGTTGTYTTYQKHPLYYFINDTEIGDVKGDGIKGVWHLIYPHSSFSDTLDVARSTTKRRQTYLTDGEGRALYFFDNDEINKSNCYDNCEAIWPIFDVKSITNVPKILNSADFGIIERNSSRSAHSTQITYQGKPLYYFVNDVNTSDTKGDWVKGVWHLIELNATAIPAPKATIGDASKGETRFLSQCNSCHGDDGRTSALGVSQIIADINDAASVKALLTYLKNDGTGKHPAMVNVAQSLSDEEIDNLSAYVATLP